MILLYKSEEHSKRRNLEPVSVKFGINRRVQLGPGYCFVLLVADRESVLIVLVTRLCELSVGVSARWRGKKILTSSQTLL